MTTQQELFTKLKDQFKGVSIPDRQDRIVHIKSDKGNVSVIFNDELIPKCNVLINNRLEYQGAVYETIDYLKTILTSNSGSSSGPDSDFD
jgi:hypothetical protein